MILAMRHMFVSKAANIALIMTLVAALGVFIYSFLIGSNLLRPLDKAWEFTGAHGKNMALKAYDAFRGASAGVPWEMVKWDDADVARFKTAPHPAFDTPAAPAPALSPAATPRQPPKP